jgi:hypothetical protein
MLERRENTHQSVHLWQKKKLDHKWFLLQAIMRCLHHQMCAEGDNRKFMLRRVTAQMLPAIEVKGAVKREFRWILLTNYRHITEFGMCSIASEM